ncbi:MAG: sugar phosphate isomerase/epimerase [Tannerella sp.]|jgi:sugar phosphate isomerase/epimerase|nr:sugar phosphate isomerase/epimerase [Tannerella sp.]
MKRRNFLKSAAATTALAAFPMRHVFADVLADKSLPIRTKISLNAFSFNEPLLAGKMSLDDLLESAAETGFEGVDLTGYYFPGYPEVPTDEYIYHIKRMAFDLGLEICGSGVRNNFAQADPEAREAAKKHVKEWVHVAAKLGGQTLRIFAGNDVPEGYSREEVFGWIVSCVKECAEYAGRYGVVLAIQNHNDFLKTADQVEEMLKAINSKSVGLMLDIGSYRTKADPYAEIRQTVKYAITWQLKEEVYVNGQAVKTDLDKMKEIIAQSTYRGYLPIETLGPGDPKQKIKALFSEVKKRFG